MAVNESLLFQPVFTAAVPSSFVFEASPASRRSPHTIRCTQETKILDGKVRVTRWRHEFSAPVSCQVLHLNLGVFHVSDIDMERVSDDVDVVIVGGGPAGMSAAIRLKQVFELMFFLCRTPMSRSETGPCTAQLRA